MQWLRDNLGLISGSEEVETLAGTVDDNGGCYFVPAFSGLYAPYWRSEARGVIAGLTRFVKSGHIARAVLEATAFQSREVVDAMALDAGMPLESLKVDGGMTVNEPLMQFQADMLGVPVVRPVVTETTALGAAYAAGLAVGVWGAPDDLREHWAEDRRWLPQMPVAEREERYGTGRRPSSAPSTGSTEPPAEGLAHAGEHVVPPDRPVGGKLDVALDVLVLLLRIGRGAAEAAGAAVVALAGRREARGEGAAVLQAPADRCLLVGDECRGDLLAGAQRLREVRAREALAEHVVLPHHADGLLGRVADDGRAGEGRCRCPSCSARAASRSGSAGGEQRRIGSQRRRHVIDGVRLARLAEHHGDGDADHRDEGHERDRERPAARAGR